MRVKRKPEQLIGLFRTHPQNVGDYSVGDGDSGSAMFFGSALCSASKAAICCVSMVAPMPRDARMRTNDEGLAADASLYKIPQLA